MQNIDSNTVVLTVDIRNMTRQQATEEMERVYLNEARDIEERTGKDVVVIPSNVSVSALNLQEDSVLVCTIDIDGMPPHQAEGYMQHVQSILMKTFPDNHVVVCPKGVEFESDS